MTASPSLSGNNRNGGGNESGNGAGGNGKNGNIKEARPVTPIPGGTAMRARPQRRKRK